MKRGHVSYQKTFFSWLGKRESSQHLHDLQIAATIVDMVFSEENILETSIFNIDDVARVRSLQKLIEEDHKFLITWSRYKINIIQMFNQYILFLKDLEKNEPVIEDVESFVQNSAVNSSTEECVFEDYRAAFISWMNDKCFPTMRVQKQLFRLNQCEDFAKKKGLYERSFFLMSSEEFDKFMIELKKISHFREWDRQQNGKVIKALEVYHTYLQDKEQGFLADQHDQKNDEDIIVLKKRDGIARAAGIRSEVDELLWDEKFVPLRNALAEHHIYTISELKDLQLWPFMNRNNLYNIATRQTVLTEVQRLLQPLKTTDNSIEYHLHYNNSVFTGENPAESFLRFCEEMAHQYPLKIRNLIGLCKPDSSLIALHKKLSEGEFLKMENPTAYIDKDLTVDDVRMLAEWVAAACSNGTHTINIETRNTFVAKELADKQEIGTPPITTPKPQPKVSDSMQGCKKSFKLYNVDKPPVLSQVAENTSQCITNAELRSEDKDQVMIEKINIYLLDADLDGMTPSHLRDALSIPMTELKRLQRLAPQIVDIQGVLYHEEAFLDWEEGADQLIDIIDKLMKKNGGYISVTQLYDYARSEMNMFLNDNGLNNERAVYDIAQHLFGKNTYRGKKYFFHGKSHISMDGYVRSIRDLCDKYALEQGGVFLYDDLKAYVLGVGLKANNLRGQLDINLRSDYMYYDKGVLLYSKNLNINDDWKRSIRTALTRLFDDVGDHIILRNVPPVWFEGLPDLPGNRPWTQLLLQYVLRFYGRELGARTIAAMDSQNNETLHTMLVQADSPLYTFGDVVIAWLLDNDISQRQFAAEELRKLLRQDGVIADNELITNMPKALGNDDRFAWDIDGEHVKIRV